MDLSQFKDPKLARGLIDSIGSLAPEQATLMEVCGTHTVAIARNGIRNLMPEGIRLASGPGCPVCVTSNRDIDTVITRRERDDRHVRRYDARARFDLELAERASRRPFDPNRVLPARRAQSCPGLPRS